MRPGFKRVRCLGAQASACAIFFCTVLLVTAEPDSFRFVIIGDRTGETVPGVYEQVWKDATAEHPAFAVSVGDTIQGLHDGTADREWQNVRQSIPTAFAVYLTPGNHDIWSPRSQDLYVKYARHPLHYSFDYGQAHFTILDNSRSDELSAAELDFLDADLKAHNDQPLKLIVSHRPGWLLRVIVGDANFRLQQIAKRYGARYVIAGHVHEMLHAQLEGVDYISMVSAGGHLRASGKYRDGWFFGYAVVDVHGSNADFRIHELGAPFGEGRVTELKQWGPAGLTK